MLAATTTLGTIMLVLSFLSGALDLSPIGNVSAWRSPSPTSAT